jgi:hypothetical protein
MNAIILFFNALLLNYFSLTIKAEVAKPPVPVVQQTKIAATPKTKIVAKTSGFTKLDAKGNVLADDAINHACVIDHANKLMWEVKTDNNDFRDKDWIFSWYDSTSSSENIGTIDGGTCYTPGRCDTEKFVQDVNAVNLCGVKDWRLPTTDELLTIVTTTETEPLINVALFPNTVAKSFWTSSLDANFSSYALIVCFNTGYVFYGYRSDSYPVRLVRTNH